MEWMSLPSCQPRFENRAGWDDERHCKNGLCEYPDENGERAIETGLARSVERAVKMFS